MKPIVILRERNEGGRELFVSDGETELIVPMTIKAMVLLAGQLWGAIYLKVK